MLPHSWIFILAVCCTVGMFSNNFVSAVPLDDSLDVEVDRNETEHDNLTTEHHKEHELQKYDTDTLEDISHNTSSVTEEHHENSEETPHEEETANISEDHENIEKTSHEKGKEESVGEVHSVGSQLSQESNLSGENEDANHVTTEPDVKIFAVDSNGKFNKLQEENSEHVNEDLITEGSGDVANHSGDGHPLEIHIEENDRIVENKNIASPEHENLEVINEETANVKKEIYHEHVAENDDNDENKNSIAKDDDEELLIEHDEKLIVESKNIEDNENSNTRVDVDEQPHSEHHISETALHAVTDANEDAGIKNRALYIEEHANIHTFNETIDTEEQGLSDHEDNHNEFLISRENEDDNEFDGRVAVTEEKHELATSNEEYNLDDDDKLSEHENEDAEEEENVNEKNDTLNITQDHDDASLDYENNENVDEVGEVEDNKDDILTESEKKNNHETLTSHEHEEQNNNLIVNDKEGTLISHENKNDNNVTASLENHEKVADSLHENKEENHSSHRIPVVHNEDTTVHENRSDYNAETLSHYASQLGSSASHEELNIADTHHSENETLSHENENENVDYDLHLASHQNEHDSDNHEIGAAHHDENSDVHEAIHHEENGENDNVDTGNYGENEDLEAVHDVESDDNLRAEHHDENEHLVSHENDSLGTEHHNENENKNDNIGVVHVENDDSIGTVHESEGGGENDTIETVHYDENDDNPRVVYHDENNDNIDTENHDENEDENHNIDTERRDENDDNIEAVHHDENKSENDDSLGAVHHDENKSENDDNIEAVHHDENKSENDDSLGAVHHDENVGENDDNIGTEHHDEIEDVGTENYDENDGALNYNESESGNDNLGAVHHDENKSENDDNIEAVHHDENKSENDDSLGAVHHDENKSENDGSLGAVHHDENVGENDDNIGTEHHENEDVVTENYDENDGALNYDENESENGNIGAVHHNESVDNLGAVHYDENVGENDDNIGTEHHENEDVGTENYEKNDDSHGAVHHDKNISENDDIGTEHHNENEDAISDNVGTENHEENDDSHGTIDHAEDENDNIGVAYHAENSTSNNTEEGHDTQGLKHLLVDESEDTDTVSATEAVPIVENDNYNAKYDDKIGTLHYYENKFSPLHENDTDDEMNYEDGDEEVEEENDSLKIGFVHQGENENSTSHKIEEGHDIHGFKHLLVDESKDTDTVSATEAVPIVEEESKEIDTMTATEAIHAYDDNEGSGSQVPDEVLARNYVIPDDQNKTKMDTLFDFMSTFNTPAKQDEIKPAGEKIDSQNVGVLEESRDDKNNEEDFIPVFSGGSEIKGSDNANQNHMEGSGDEVSSIKPVEEIPVIRTDIGILPESSPTSAHSEEKHVDEDEKKTDTQQPTLQPSGTDKHLEEEVSEKTYSQVTHNSEESTVATPSPKQMVGNTESKTRHGSVNEVGFGEQSTNPDDETQKSSTGSYVVLGVIMVVIVALLGYSVFRSRRRRRAKKSENFGKEMKDIEKNLLAANGNGTNIYNYPVHEGEEVDESKTKLLAHPEYKAGDGEDGETKDIEVVINSNGATDENSQVENVHLHSTEIPVNPSPNPFKTMTDTKNSDHVIEIAMNKSPTQLARDRFFNNQFQPRQPNEGVSGMKPLVFESFKKTLPSTSASVNVQSPDESSDLTPKVKVVEKMDEDSVLKRPMIVNRDQNGVP